MIAQLNDYGFFKTVFWDPLSTRLLNDGEKEVCVDRLAHVFKGIADFKTDADKQDFFYRETGLDFEGAFQRAKDVSFGLFINHKSDQNTDISGRNSVVISYDRQLKRGYFGIAFSLQRIKEKSPEHLSAIGGHEMGHIFDGLRKQNFRSLMMAEPPAASDRIAHTHPRLTRLYGYSPEKSVADNWQLEYNMDAFAALVDPQGCNIGTVLDRQPSFYNQLFVAGQMGLPTARVLSRFCTARNRAILSMCKDNIDWSHKSLPILKGMRVDPYHPAPISRSVRQVAFRQNLRNFEEQRREKSMILTI